MEEHGIRADDVTRIVREVIPAMIDDSLEGPNCTEQGSLAVIQASKTETNREADAVNGNGLEGVVVEGAVGEWHIYIVVHGVDMFC